MGEVQAVAITPVDTGTFEAIARREADRLYGLALTILRDPAEAEDAVQDALLAAWRFWPNLRDPARVQPWLTRICVNAALRRRRWISHLTAQHDADRVLAPAIGRDERLLGFDRAFARLSLKQRAVFALHVHYGLTVEECARTVGCSSGAARSHLGRAVDKLRRDLGDD